MQRMTVWFALASVLFFSVAAAGRSVPLPGLIMAVERGNIAEVRKLLAAGADVNVSDPDTESLGWGRTALMSAADKGRADIVRLLLDAGANVDAKDGSGRSPLVMAAGRAYPKVVKMLLAAKADVNAKARSGETPLIAASGLWETGMGQTFEDQVTVVKLLLAAGADVNARDQCGETALMWATINNIPGVPKPLIAAKADVNLKATAKCGGDSPLIEAAAFGNFDVVKMLLAAGADINARNTKGETALSKAESGAAIVRKNPGAKRNPRQQYQAVIDYLRSRGAVR